MLKSAFLVRIRKITIVRTAAGSTIKKLARNLSFISHPCVLTAAIVVSEIIDRLSPNMAPQTTAPIQIGSANPVFSLILTAIGARAAIVPIEVPMEIEIKQPMIKSPTTAILAGRMDNPRETVLSAPPAAVTAPEKAPAHRKIRLIVMIFSSPTPFVITLIFSSKFNAGFWKNATISAIRNPIIAGML